MFMGAPAKPMLWWTPTHQFQTSSGAENVVDGQLRRQHLERDVAAQAGILGLIDNAYPAPAENGAQR